VAGLALFAGLAYWLLVLTEGAYLGSRVVCKLYDWTAGKYESIKQFDPYHERCFVGQPVAEALSHVSSPIVLDVAAGTSRFARALLDAGPGRGTTIGIDRSRPMLLEGRRFLAPGEKSVALVQADALKLPFPGNSFNAVVSLEALEFLPSVDVALREMTRVLRPGGVLFITNRKGAARRYMPGHVHRAEEVVALLAELGIANAGISRWQVNYDLVHGRKAQPAMQRPRAEASRPN